ncbi:MAG: terminase small subunit [Lachnospirales bacterium]
MKVITKKQKRFAEEYLVDCNATQAAIRSGYSSKTAYSSGSRILKNPVVQEYVKKQLDKLSDERVADAKEVMAYLSDCLRGITQSEIVVIESEGDGVTTSRKILKCPDEKERLKAAELLGKRYGLFKENIEFKGNIPVVIAGYDEV